MFGWGGGGGRVYQKAYVEFFASEALLDGVLEACASRPWLNYYAVRLRFLVLFLEMWGAFFVFFFFLVG